MGEDPALGDTLDLLNDEHARDILAATSTKPMSAQELTDECEMPKSTVYRRVERLQAYGLLDEQTEIRTSNNRYSVYTATLSEFSVALNDGSFEASLTRTDDELFPGEGESDTVDRFKRIWENL